MAPTRATTQLSSVLQSVLKNLRDDSRVSKEQIQGVWKRLVGEEASLHSWPRRLNRGRLLVEVDSSSWMYALNLQKGYLVEGLVELMGAKLVRQLSFRIGESEDKDGKKA